ncbi:MAG: hypothetical protein VKJ66_00025 [Synechococcus sp.]|nr:hypothetical protein [Synechococcus sp.]
MRRLKNALGIPQSVNLFGLIQACPILVACLTLAVVVLAAAFLG